MLATDGLVTIKRSFLPEETRAELVFWIGLAFERLMDESFLVKISRRESFHDLSLELFKFIYPYKIIKNRIK